METKFNFDSSPCTSKEQSERFLALGIRNETADCYYWQECDQYGDPNGKWHLDILNDDTREHFKYLFNHFGICPHLEDALFIPAWSLHRLIELALCDVEMNIFISRRCFWINKPHLSPTRSDLEGSVFDGMIDYIEWLIKKGYFNKEYLENGNC